jgi:hypothetical protein
MKNALILLLLAATWIVVAMVLLAPEAPNVGGVAHPRFAAPDENGKPQMLQGGDGALRHGPILLSSWALSALMVTGIVALLAWSLSIGRSNQRKAVQQTRTSFFWPVVVVGFVLFQGAFAMIFWTYSESLADPASPTFLGPFPAAETWYFATWLAPLYFAAIYVIFFHDWVAPPENLRRFEELVAGRARESVQQINEEEGS